MKVKPISDFHLLGTQEKIQKGKTYEAERAINQPDWIKKGEYEIVEK